MIVEKYTLHFKLIFFFYFNKNLNIQFLKNVLILIFIYKLALI